MGKARAARLFTTAPGGRGGPAALIVAVRRTTRSGVGDLGGPPPGGAGQAQHESFEGSVVKAWQASLMPSAMVR